MVFFGGFFWLFVCLCFSPSVGAKLFPSPAKFWPNPTGENPCMPKIYAKHNSVPCGFMTAEKPAGGGRAPMPQQNAPRPRLREGASVRGGCPLELPHPTEQPTASPSRVPVGACAAAEARFGLLQHASRARVAPRGRHLGCGHRGLPLRRGCGR